MRGIIKTPLQELIKFTIRFGLIYSLALNWHFFSTYVVDLFVTGSEELAGVLLKTGKSYNSLTLGLQEVFSKIMRLGNSTLAQTSFRHPSPIITSLLIFASGMLVVGLALIEIMVAKLMLALCLCSAPLFFCFTLFDKTKNFFDRWLGTLVGFALVLILVSSVIGFSINLLEWASSQSTKDLTAIGWVPILLVSIFCFSAISQTAAIAKNIGGACHTAGGAALVGGFLGSALGGRFSHSLNFSKNVAGSLASSGKTALTASATGLKNIYQALKK